MGNYLAGDKKAPKQTQPITNDLRLGRMSTKFRWELILSGLIYVVIDT